ncbi:MAG: hypothetical protein EPO08_17530 [Rhodospirillaceae bacterium]|nr:MAG: hypothetical protein EPO08_17530 [Rhodospirillaceae bacterium]
MAPNSESMLWEILTIKDANSYWGEIEYYHNFSRARLCALLEQFEFSVVHFALSERYRLGMEIIAKRD